MMMDMYIYAYSIVSSPIKSIGDNLAIFCSKNNLIALVTINIFCVCVTIAICFMNLSVFICIALELDSENSRNQRL